VAEGVGTEVLPSDVPADSNALDPALTRAPRLRALWQRPAPRDLGNKQACATLDEAICQEGTRRVCALYDTDALAWASAPPAMTDQAYVFDRYYDLYHSPQGQAMDLSFTGPVPYGTPEAEWSDPSHFRRYDGYGDSSGWTGTALLGAAGRYAATGTDADFQRLVHAAEDALLQYEITAIPGLLARAHYGMLPEGGPDPVGHPDKAIGRHRTAEEFGYSIDEGLLERVPAYYSEGVEIGGEHVDLTPTWQGDASRDMYVRGLPGVLAAYDLLGDDARGAAVREGIRRQLPCTLTRMKKGRITNLSKNDLVRDALTAYLAGANMQIDPGDQQWMEGLDTLIFYVQLQPRPGEEQDAFEGTCPDVPPMEVDPEFDYDASKGSFLVQLAELAAREAKTYQGKTPIAWTQHISVRGSDTVFMLQWALVAHYLTADERFLDFVEQMVAEVDVVHAIGTYGSFILPKWCAPHYAPSITYPSLYNLLARLDPAEDGAWWRMLSEAVVEEGRHKELATREDCYFGVLYARMMDATTDPAGAAWVEHLVNRLATYGMDPTNKREPDRNAPRNWIDHPDPEIPLEEIPAGALALCTEPITIAGIEIPAAGLEDDWPRAVDAIPLPKRVGGAFLWQMDPWMAKREYGGAGMDDQWPMLGMTVPYWVGRADGTISEGRALVAAWRDTGETCP